MVLADSGDSARPAGVKPAEGSPTVTRESSHELTTAGSLHFQDSSKKRAWRMRVSSPSGNLPIILSALWAASIFLLIYGPYILNPCYTDWILCAGQQIDPDNAWHHLGWVFYRQSRWLIPPGMAETLMHPFPTSVLMTDSIPLLAMGFKTLSRLLPDNFQYFGMWGLGCFILHGSLGALLLKKYLKSPVLIVAGSTFFILNWVAIFRLYRITAVSAQWPSLLALVLLIYYEEIFYDWKKASLAWGTLGVLCAGTHVYCLPMVGALLLAFMATHFVKAFRTWRPCGLTRHLLSTLAPLIYFIGCAMTAIALAGGFTGHQPAPSINLPHDSLNLNAFFNSYGRGVVLGALPSHDKDELPEGFAYLGAGSILLLLISLGAVCTKIRWSCVRSTCSRAGLLPFLRSNIKILSLGLAAVVLILLASLPAIHFGESQIFPAVTREFLAPFYSAFRAKGRLAWPVIHMLVLFSLCADRRVLGPRVKMILIVICLGIQFLDLSREIQDKQSWFKPLHVYESPLKNPVWQEIAANQKIRHIVFLPGFIDHTKFHLHDFFALADFASRNHMTMNDFIFARAPLHQLEAEQLPEELLAQPPPDTLFVLNKTQARHRFRHPAVVWHPADGFYLGRVEGSLAQPSMSPAHQTIRRRDRENTSPGRSLRDRR